jgi:hypothetical protein
MFLFGDEKLLTVMLEEELKSARYNTVFFFLIY